MVSKERERWSMEGRVEGVKRRKVGGREMSFEG